MQEKRKFRVQTLTGGITYRDMFWLTAIIVVVSLALYFGNNIAKNTSNTANQNIETKDSVFGIVLMGCIRFHTTDLEHLREGNPVDISNCLINSGYVPFNLGVQLNTSAQTMIVERCLSTVYLNIFDIENEIINCVSENVDWVQIPVSPTPTP